VETPKLPFPPRICNRTRREIHESEAVVVINLKIVGIDPGPVESAFCELNCESFPIGGNSTIGHAGIVYNDQMFREFDQLSVVPSPSEPYTSRIFVFEKVESFGMPVGADVFETVWWTGRFMQYIYDQIGVPPLRITRREIKLHLCNSARAKDANIRQALIDRYGDKGTKKNPGQTYGFKRDMWSALAIATTFYEIQEAR